ncbi:MAG: hypothetical protein ACYSU7_17330, partial [Planctomycetota bacterium]
MHGSLRTPILLAFVLLHGSTPRPCEAPSAGPRVFRAAQAAYWIFHPGVTRDPYGVFHFRRVVTLENAPETFVA